MSKKDYAGARTAFEECVKLAPADPVALSELGWAAFLDNDGGRGEEATVLALAGATTGELRAATLYNFGRMRERDGDTLTATEAYVASLRLRPNANTSARLAKVAAGGSAAIAPTFAATPLEGPIPDLQAYCRGQASGGRGEKCACRTEKVTGPAGAPYRAIVLSGISCATRDDPAYVTDKVRLAVQLDDGWYVGARHEGREPNAKRCNDRWSARIDPSKTALMIHLAEAVDCGGGDLDKDFRWEWVVRIGIGASGKPSETPPILVAVKELLGYDKDVLLADFRLIARATPDGLELDGKPTPSGWGPEMLSRVVGKHPVAHP